MGIDDCIKNKSPQCKVVPWKYIEFICGNGPSCNSRSDKTVKRSVEIAKHALLNRFSLVGILEQFDDTMKLLVKKMPYIFEGIEQANKSPRMAKVRNMTKSVGQVKMNEKSRRYFETGPLKYEYDLYKFARQLFNEQLRRSELKK